MLNSNYSALRTEHYSRATARQRATLDAERPLSDRIHAVIVCVIARRGVAAAIRDRDAIRRECRKQLGVPVLAFAWFSLALAVLKILLPLMLAWLAELAEREQRKFGSVAHVDVQWRTWAVAAREEL